MSKGISHGCNIREFWENYTLMEFTALYKVPFYLLLSRKTILYTEATLCLYLLLRSL